MRRSRQGDSRGIGVGLCRNLDMNFREYLFPRTPVNKDKKEGPQPRRTRPFPLFPPLSACFLLSWEELEELRMQSFEEALRDGRKEFIFRTQAEEHLLAVGGEHVFAVDYHPVEAAAARN